MLKEKEVLDAERKLLCAFGMDGFHMEENAVLMDHIIFAIKERIWAGGIDIYRPLC